MQLDPRLVECYSRLDEQDGGEEREDEGSSGREGGGERCGDQGWGGGEGRKREGSREERGEVI